MLLKHDRERSVSSKMESIDLENGDIYCNGTERMSSSPGTEQWLMTSGCEKERSMRSHSRDSRRRFAPRFPEVFIFLAMMVLLTTLYLFGTHVLGTW